MPATHSSSGGTDISVKNATSAASPVTRYSMQVLVVSLISFQAIVRYAEPRPRRAGRRERRAR